MLENRKNYVCWNPYTYMEIHENGLAAPCCPAWIKARFDTFKLKEQWGSNYAWEVRKTIEDGTYRFCSSKMCPVLTAIDEGRADGVIEKVTPETFNWTKDKLPPLKHIKFCFDPSCNLACKTCREGRIFYTDQKRKEVDLIIRYIEENLAQDLELIDVSGSGEVFFSPSFRNWLINFDPVKYPKIRNIHLHTNAQLWTEAMWNGIGKATPYIHSAEISIDAATKETYEKIRRGGSWERLIKNLKFISTLPLEVTTFSFVVQRDNYKEIRMYYDLIKDLFGNSGIEWKVMYGRVADWGRLTPEHFAEVNIFADPKATEEIEEVTQTLAKEHKNVITNI